MTSTSNTAINPEPKTKTRTRKKITPDRWLSILFLVPSIILIAVFVYGFIGWTGYISTVSWAGIVPNFTFSGLTNYIQLFKDFRFQADIRNTLVFTILFILFVVILGQFLAVLIERKLRGKAIFRNIFLFPMALSFVVTGVVWQWVLNPSTGVNLFLKKIGINFGWYTDTTVWPSLHIGSIEWGIPVALISVVIAAVWQMTGFSLAMYLAGLNGIPVELREAARMDGATEFQIYRKVILPMMRPITFSVIIVMAHISLKIFDLIYAMTGPGANFVTDMPGVYMFETTFRSHFYSQGAAIAIIMLLAVAIFIVPYLIRSRKGE